MGSNTKKNNYKEHILQILNNSASGLTLSEIAEEVCAHRNTVSKYLFALEAEKEVIKKEVGTANLYTTTKRNYLKREIVVDFVKALFYGLKGELPNKEQIFKKVGHKLLERFEFPMGQSYLEVAEKVRENPDPKFQIKIFKELYNSFDFLQGGVEVSYIELQNERVVYRFKNTAFLDSSEDYIYYFYLMCGIAEGLFLRYFNSKIECNVEGFTISQKGFESFIDISIKFKMEP
jgi:transcriptional regulator with XRE-family HTH domain